LSSTPHRRKSQRLSAHVRGENFNGVIVYDESCDLIPNTENEYWESLTWPLKKNWKTTEAAYGRQQIAYEILWMFASTTGNKDAVTSTIMGN
jgi:hypothetical protein